MGTGSTGGGRDITKNMIIIIINIKAKNLQNVLLKMKKPIASNTINKIPINRFDRILFFLIFLAAGCFLGGRFEGLTITNPNYR
jgi:hypothetical protein